MAEWCAVSGFAPNVYRETSIDERAAIYAASKRVKGLK